MPFLLRAGDSSAYGAALGLMISGSMVRSSPNVQETWVQSLEPRQDLRKAW